MREDIKLQVKKGNMLRHSFKERTSLRRKLIAKFSLRTGKRPTSFYTNASLSSKTTMSREYFMTAIRLER